MVKCTLCLCHIYLQTNKVTVSQSQGTTLYASSISIIIVIIMLVIRHNRDRPTQLLAWSL